MSYGFPALLTIVTFGTSAYVALFFHGAAKLGRRWVSEDSRNSYVSIANTLITSSGIAVALLATLGRTRAPTWMLHRAMDALVISIVFAVFFILVFVRRAEIAMGSRNDKRDLRDVPMGSLGDRELLLILLLGWIAITAFLWGFLYLGRLVLWI